MVMMAVSSRFQPLRNRSHLEPRNPPNSETTYRFSYPLLEEGIGTVSGYFILDVNDFVEPAPGLTRELSPPEGFDSPFWMRGRLLAPPPLPIEAELYRGSGMSEVFLDSIPFFRADVLKVLEAAGVSNLQAFSARLFDRERGTVSTDYFAVNVIGCVACADLEKSDFTPPNAPAFRTAFRRLVIDASKANGVLFFRLYESISKLIVHSTVKHALEQAQFRYLRFIPA